MWRRLRVVAFVFALCAACVSESNAARSVEVALSAGWNSTSISLEALAYALDVDRDAFWTLARSLDEGVSDSKTECDGFIDEASRRAHGSAASARAAGLARGLRVASPRVAATRDQAETDVGTSDGCCRVMYAGETYGEVEALGRAIEGGTTEGARGRRAEPRDAFWRDDNVNISTAIAYAAPGTACFAQMHEILAGASDAGRLNYVLRPTLFDGCARDDGCAALGQTGDNLRLAGFGVELAVKNMEYKAIDDSKVKPDGGESEDGSDDEATTASPAAELKDESVLGFNFAKLSETYPDHVEGLRSFRDELMGKAQLSSDAPLKLWDIGNLGLQATQRIALADDPLRELVELSQNFPSLANGLSRMKLNSTLVNEVKGNHKMVYPGGLVMSLNGENLELDTIDIYTLTDTISKEIQHSQTLSRLGLSESAVSRLLRFPGRSGASVKVNMTSDSINFFNDVEKDLKYKRWSKNLGQLRFQAQGGFHRVKYNMYNLAVFLDPSKPSTWDVIGMMAHFQQSTVPVRMAQVVVTKLGNEDPELKVLGERVYPDVGEPVMRAANYILQQYGAVAQHEFLAAIAASRRPHQDSSPWAPPMYYPPSVSMARASFVKTLNKYADDSEFEADELFDEFESSDSPKADKYVDAVRAHVLRKGLTTQSFLLNGEYGDEMMAFRGQATLDQLIVHSLRQEMSRMQRLAFTDELTEATKNMAEFVQQGATTKYVPWIVDTQKFPPVYHAPIPFASIDALEYVQHGDMDVVKAMSLVVVADGDTDLGAAMIAAAVSHVSSHAGRNSRITVVHSGVNVLGERARAIQAALHVPTRRTKIAKFLEELLSSREASAEEIAERVGLNADDFNRVSNDEKLMVDVVQHSKRFLSYHRMSSHCAIVANGRVLDLTERKCTIDVTDIDALVEVEMAQRSTYIFDVVSTEMLGKSEPIIEPKLLSQAISDAAALVAVKQRKASNKRTVESLDKLIAQAKSTAFVAGTGTIVQIEAVLDPLSKEAQRVAPVLALLRDRLPDEVTIRVVLNPRAALQDLPLKSYYRYALPPATLDVDPLVVITNVPTHKTFTTHVDFPEPWMVTTHKAKYDLDNLILKDIKEKVVSAEYRLESILITGHVSDVDKDQTPARGTQLILEDKNTAVNPGTIVMSNLGYFQLPSSPGRHRLSLRAGASADIFAFKEVHDLLVADSEELRVSDDELSIDVLVDSFAGLRLDISLKRRACMETADVLDAGLSSTSPSGWLSKVLKKKSNDRIHIFSVASGHLYERFLKIMMASVKRSTKNPVKFWFIKNWLSPSFKDFLPHMAEKYDFEYELVSYKWPTWLNKQTEKQRIIWAYKILFLDVLFPLELNKVIFVDADQIVRADMSELWNMKLNGAPYGYTPMCDNNKEMEGFRFWKQGFWQTHLRGKPYHISALYVVDLDRFRAVAVGDRLRVMYDSLSRDPGSLANLDQDLPNYAQHDVPIFSLPMPWLWCESWCGNETKAAAKTIDLCNNPLTKEPKLEGARRIVAEWPELDAEVRAFTEVVEHGWRATEPTVKDEL